MQSEARKSEAEVSISDLSRGNQQKAILALATGGARISFLDEPTCGIDVGAKEQVYELIDELARQRTAVTLVSSEMPELLRCTDRVTVLPEGRQADIVYVGSTSQEQILAMEIGFGTGPATTSYWAINAIQ